MSKHFYDSAQTRLWGAAYAGVVYSSANCRGTNKPTQTAGVSLRTGKTGWRSDGNCRCTGETIRLETIWGRVAGIEVTCDFAERENKIARTAVRSCSPT